MSEHEVHSVAAEGFDKGADAYERARPSYPAEAVAVLVERLGIGPGRRVLDLAAGTGKLTRLLLPTGADVVALEPVPGMRAQLEQAVPGIEVLGGTAEAVPAPDASFDAVVCAQAWHWFDSPVALREVARLLRAPERRGADKSPERRGADKSPERRGADKSPERRGTGKSPERRGAEDHASGLAVLFNIRDSSVDWVHQVTEISEFYDANRPHHRETRARFAAEVDASGAFGPVELHTFRYHHTMTPDLLVERMASQSNVAIMDEAKRTDVLDRVRELTRTHPDLSGRDEFDMPYDTEVALCFLR